MTDSLQRIDSQPLANRSTAPARLLERLAPSPRAGALGPPPIVVGGRRPRLPRLPCSTKLHRADPHRPERPERPRLRENARADDALEDFYQTQYRLLQSRLLARKVVEQLTSGRPRVRSPRSVDAIAAAESAAPGAPPDMERRSTLPRPRLKIQPVKNSQLVAMGSSPRGPSWRRRRRTPWPRSTSSRPRLPLPRLRRGRELARGPETKEQTQKIEAAERALQSSRSARVS